MNQAIVITIGNELLQGYTLDTNASWISSYLRDRDIEVSNRLTVGDSKQEIVSSLSYAINKIKINLIIITGGLGPTHDDITKDVLKEYFSTDFIIDKNYLSILKSKFVRINMRIPKNISSQATYLKNSLPISNKNGTALGMQIVDNNVTILVLPGVPSEMKQMVQDCDLFKTLKLKNKYYTIKTAGIYENKLYEILFKEIKSNKNFKVAFLPNYSGVDIRLSRLSKISEKLFSEFKHKIRKLIGKYIYSDSDELLEEVLGKKLNTLNLKLSIAESCTGGIISKKITNVPGASKYFLGSVIAYNNNIKKKILNVNKETIEKFGPVSEEVAIEMARGVLLITDSDISVATTGISGPDGGSDEKPIGLIYIAINYRNKNIVKKFNLPSNRKIHREIASNIALNMIRLVINK